MLRNIEEQNNSFEAKDIIRRHFVKISGITVLGFSSYSSGKESVKLAVREATGRPVRTKASVKHPGPEGYKPGNPITIEISLDRKPSTVLMHFRHVNHAERFMTSGMTFNGSSYQATIPAEFTTSEYPLQYYFEFNDEQGKAWLYPGFSENLDNQPYFVLRNA